MGLDKLGEHFFRCDWRRLRAIARVEGSRRTDFDDQFVRGYCAFLGELRLAADDECRRDKVRSERPEVAGALDLYRGVEKRQLAEALLLTKLSSFEIAARFGVEGGVIDMFAKLF